MGDITTAFSKQYGTNVFLLAQQKKSRLRDTVTIDADFVGEAKFIEQLAATAASKRTTRHGDTPLVDPDHRRRKIIPFDYEWAHLLDKQDKLKMIVDPTGKYVQSGAAAFGRSIDDEVILAVSGTAYTGKEGTTPVVLPAAQKIAVAGAGLNLAKLLEAKEILDSADVPEDEERFCIVTAKQVTDLLNTTEIKNADYNTVKALAMGQIDAFLGFKFVRSQRLAVDSSSDRLVLCYLKTGVTLGIPQDITSRISERADKSYLNQVYTAMSIGAVRTEEVQVVEIACQET